MTQAHFSQSEARKPHDIALNVTNLKKLQLPSISLPRAILGNNVSKFKITRFDDNYYKTTKEWVFVQVILCKYLEIMLLNIPPNKLGRMSEINGPFVVLIRFGYCGLLEYLVQLDCI